MFPFTLGVQPPDQAFVENMKKMKALQWQVEQQRQQAPSPLPAARPAQGESPAGLVRALAEIGPERTEETLTVQECEAQRIQTWRALAATYDRDAKAAEPYLATALRSAVLTFRFCADDLEQALVLQQRLAALAGEGRGDA